MGPFPMVQPFQGEFRFGWSGIEVASAQAKFSQAGKTLLVEVEGGTTGLARTLWKLGATHKVKILKKGLSPLAFHQVETYATRTTTTDAVFKTNGLWYLRQTTPAAGPPAQWQRLEVEPIRDIISALLYIRSQPLQDKDKVAVAAFPGNHPYLMEATVTGREIIRSPNGPMKAIRLDFSLRHIEGNRLLPCHKFNHGAVWLSDDANRIPLRAEVDIFIGSVYGELTSLTMMSQK